MLKQLSWLPGGGQLADGCASARLVHGGVVGEEQVGLREWGSVGESGGHLEVQDCS